MKKKILVQVNQVTYYKVKNSLKSLNKYYVFDFYIPDSKKNIKTVSFFEIIFNIYSKNKYFCSLDFYKNKKIKDIFLFKCLKSKIKIINPILAPKARHFFKEKKNINFFLKLIFQPFKFKNFFYKFFNKLVKYDGFILAGSYNNKNIKNNSNLIIYTHSFDYEKLIKKNLKKKRKKNKIKRILFLDEMMQNHPDYLNQNLPIPINYKEYVNEMNSIFKKISIIKNFKAEIAFHPKSDQKYMSDFKFVKKYFHNTINAIEKSDLIIAHGSTTLGIAAAFNKPIILLISKKMKFTWMESYIKTIGKNLNCKIYYTDKFLQNINRLNLKRLVQLNSNNSSFINKFLCHPKKDKRNNHIWDSFHKHILNNNGI